jgi:hypothetical protein
MGGTLHRTMAGWRGRRCRTGVVGCCGLANRIVRHCSRLRIRYIRDRANMAPSMDPSSFDMSSRHPSQSPPTPFLPCTTAMRSTRRYTGGGVVFVSHPFGILPTVSITNSPSRCPASSLCILGSTPKRQQSARCSLVDYEMTVDPRAGTRTGGWRRHVILVFGEF